MDLSGKRVVVMGLGRFGGGVGVTRFLVKRGADVLVTDLEPPDHLQRSLAQLHGLPVQFRLGEHNVSDFTTADLIVVNPAVDQRENRFIRAAKAANIPTTSEIRLLIAHLPAPRRQTIGITGSAGKSTTTAMVGHILEKVLGDRGPKVWVGGNLGGSLLDKLDQITPRDWVVLELSSFMLDDMEAGGDRWSPHIAAVTNLLPNHLDRHGSLEAYRAAKQVILKHQTTDDFAVLGDGVRDWPTRARVLSVGLSSQQIELLIPGEHNVLNARMAASICDLAVPNEKNLLDLLSDFPGLPHRLQFVCEYAGVRFFNDSKATTPEATMLALRGFEPARVHLILGGYDKKSDLSMMAQSASDHCRAIYTLGATGDAIAALTQAHGGPAEVVRCGTLDRALAEIMPRLHRGDVVLLSPGCASWDQFENFEQRGAAFVEAVLKYTSEGAPAPSPS